MVEMQKDPMEPPRFKSAKLVQALVSAHTCRILKDKTVFQDQ